MAVHSVIELHVDGLCPMLLMGEVLGRKRSPWSGHVAAMPATAIAVAGAERDLRGLSAVAAACLDPGRHS